MIDEQVRELLSEPAPGQNPGAESETLFVEREGSQIVIRVFHYPNGQEVAAWLARAQERCEALGGELYTDSLLVYTANNRDVGDPPDAALALVSGQDLAVKKRRRRR